jgi:tartrate dehydratase alpha subunit/fumarate hydratase class I-like protein
MQSKERYVETFVELIRRASTELPRDVVAALEEGRKREVADSLGQLS